MPQRGRKEGYLVGQMHLGVQSYKIKMSEMNTPELYEWQKFCFYRNVMDMCSKKMIQIPPLIDERRS